MTNQWMPPRSCAAARATALTMSVAIALWTMAARAQSLAPGVEARVVVRDQAPAPAPANRYLAVHAQITSTGDVVFNSIGEGGTQGLYRWRPDGTITPILITPHTVVGDVGSYAAPTMGVATGLSVDDDGGVLLKLDFGGTTWAYHRDGADYMLAEPGAPCVGMPGTQVGYADVELSASGRAATVRCGVVSVGPPDTLSPILDFNSPLPGFLPASAIGAGPVRVADTSGAVLVELTGSCDAADTTCQSTPRTQEIGSAGELSSVFGSIDDDLGLSRAQLSGAGHLRFFSGNVNAREIRAVDDLVASTIAAPGDPFGAGGLTFTEVGMAENTATNPELLFAADDGSVVFKGELSDGRRGVFRASGGAIDAVFLEGDGLPDSLGAVVTEISYLVASPAGRVAFLADYVEGSSKTAVVAESPSGALRLALAPGMTVTDDDGAPFEVDLVQIGRVLNPGTGASGGGMYFNAAGDLAVHAQTAGGGDSGVLRVTVGDPEPITREITLTAQVDGAVVVDEVASLSMVVTAATLGLDEITLVVTPVDGLTAPGSVNSASPGCVVDSDVATEFARMTCTRALLAPLESWTVGMDFVARDAVPLSFNVRADAREAAAVDQLVEITPTERGADLQIVFDGIEPIGSATSALRFAYTNAGPDPATAVTIVCDDCGGLELTYDGSRPTELEAGQLAYVFVEDSAGRATTVDVTLTISSDVFDPDPSNNSASGSGALDGSENEDAVKKKKCACMTIADGPPLAAALVVALALLMARRRRTAGELAPTSKGQRRAGKEAPCAASPSLSPSPRP